jgi:ribosome-binding protein aMBF1 (putative translation factor)
MFILNTFSARLACLRQQHKLSTEELASFLAITEEKAKALEIGTATPTQGVRSRFEQLERLEQFAQRVA